MLEERREKRSESVERGCLGSGKEKVEKDGGRSK